MTIKISDIQLFTILKDKIGEEELFQSLIL